jgi:hypothetical protein
VGSKDESFVQLWDGTQISCGHVERYINQFLRNLAAIIFLGQNLANFFIGFFEKNIYIFFKALMCSFWRWLEA